MAIIEKARIKLSNKNKEDIGDAHTKALIQEYPDRRGALRTARLQEVAGYLATTVGITALLAASAFAPWLSAPAAGMLAASGSVTSEVGGGTLLFGWFRKLWNGSRLKAIPGRA